MRVINKLTKPGDIRRVDLMPDTVRIQTSDGKERVYNLFTELTVVCAWCGKHLGVKDGKGESGVSHGICPECSTKELAKHEAQR